MEIPSEVQLSSKEVDYFERLTKIIEERTEKPNLSFGIIIEQQAEKDPNEKRNIIIKACGTTLVDELHTLKLKGLSKFLILDKKLPGEEKKIT